MNANNTILALFALVFQNTALAIFLKLTFRQDAEPYTTSSVVLVTELVKFTFCSSIAAYQSTQNFVRIFIIHPDQWLIFVPSVLYVVQNNLLFFGAKMLPTVVYVVCTQTKILTTALMSRITTSCRTLHKAELQRRHSETTRAKTVWRRAHNEAILNPTTANIAIVPNTRQNRHSQHHSQNRHSPPPQPKTL